MTPDEDSLHTLLAEGRLSGAQRERILANVLRQTTPSNRNWLIAAAAAVVPLAAGAILYLRTSAGPGSPESGAAPVPRGANGPTASARCEGRAFGDCHLGDRLLFEAEGVEAPSHFAGYATCGTRERVWYFPNDDGTLPALPVAPRTVLNRAARLGPEHGVGLCELHLFVLPRPLSREAILASEARGSDTTVFGTHLRLEVKP